MALERRFINEPSELVREWNRAQLYLQPGLGIDEKFSVLYKRDVAHAGRVTVISGGGSGHEPAHSGYLGEGMLDATVSGAIFASPNVRQIYRALEIASSPQGTIVVVKNYTGDKLNFALATERFKAATGKDVQIVIVADDVSVGRSRGKFVGRRGLAGTILVHKIVGAAAQCGFSLDKITALCNIVSQGLGSIGASLAPCYVPGKASLSETKFDGIALGMGIHNEPAISHLAAGTTTTDLVEEMLDLLLDPTKTEHSFLSPEVGKQDGRLVLLINNLGGISTIELGSITSIVISHLKQKYDVVPCRVYAGTFLSALDGRGFSITLLSLDNSPTTSTILELLDQPTTARGWNCTVPQSQWDSRPSTIASTDSTETQISHSNVKSITCDSDLFIRIIRSILTEVTAQEPTITRNDTVLGDGDCGTTLLAGITAVARGLDAGILPVSSLSRGMATLAELVTDAMGGTSGAIYGIFLSALAAALSRSYNEEISLNGRYFALALSDALEVLKGFTGARIGDRTLMDALIPFVTTFKEVSQDKNTVDALSFAIQSAADGCESTRYMESRFGRSTYVGNTAAGTNHTGPSATQIPDPGACGIVAVLTGLLYALQ